MYQPKQSRHAGGIREAEPERDLDFGGQKRRNDFGDRGYGKNDE